MSVRHRVLRILLHLGEHVSDNLPLLVLRHVRQLKHNNASSRLQSSHSNFPNKKAKKALFEEKKALFEEKKALLMGLSIIYSGLKLSLVSNTIL